MSLSHRTRDCACGSGTVCQAISAAFYMIRDPRRGYIEMPPYHPPVSEYYEQQNRIRNAYLRHLCPYRVDFPDEELPRHIALHHFHPEVVIEFAQERHLSSRKSKIPLTVTQEEMQRLRLGLGEEDRVLDEDGRRTNKFYFCPNYPMKNVQQDLKECVRRERNKRSFTEGTKERASSGLKTRSRSHSRSRDESATKTAHVSLRSLSQSRPVRTDSRGHSSKRSHELPPVPPAHRHPAMDDSGYDVGPGDAILNFTVAVPESGGRLPPPPRDLKSPTPSDPSQGKKSGNKAKPEVLIVPEASVGSGSRGRVNVYINFDEEKKPAESLARIPSVKRSQASTMNDQVDYAVARIPSVQRSQTSTMNDQVEYAVQPHHHHHRQPRRSKSEKHENDEDITDVEKYRRKRKKEKSKRKKRDGALIIPTNIVLVCGRDTPDHMDEDRSGDLLVPNDHNTSTTGSMDEPVDEFTTPMEGHGAVMPLSSPGPLEEGVNPLHQKLGAGVDGDSGRMGHVDVSHARHNRTTYVDDYDIDSAIDTSEGRGSAHESRPLTNQEFSAVAPKYGAKVDNYMVDSSLEADQEVAHHFASKTRYVDGNQPAQSAFAGSKVGGNDYPNSSQNDISFVAPTYGANSIPNSQQANSAYDTTDGTGAANDYFSNSHSDILFVAPRYGVDSVPKDNNREEVSAGNASAKSMDASEDYPSAFPKKSFVSSPKFKPQLADSDLDEKSLGWDERSDEKSVGMADKSDDTPYGMQLRSRRMNDTSEDVPHGMEDRSDDGPHGMEDRSDDGPDDMEDMFGDGPYGTDDRSDDRPYRMEDRSEDGLLGMEDKSEDGPHVVEDKSDDELQGMADKSDDGPQATQDSPKSEQHGMEETPDAGQHVMDEDAELPVTQAAFKRAVSEPLGELLCGQLVDDEKRNDRAGPQSSPQSVAGFDMYVPQIQEHDYEEMEMTPEHFDDLNSTPVIDDIHSLNESNGEKGDLPESFDQLNSESFTPLQDGSVLMSSGIRERDHVVPERLDDLSSLRSAKEVGSERATGNTEDRSAGVETSSYRNESMSCAEFDLHIRSEDQDVARDDHSVRGDNGSINSRAMSGYSTTSTALFLGDICESTPLLTTSKDVDTSAGDEQNGRLQEEKFESFKVPPEESVRALSETGSFTDEDRATLTSGQSRNVAILTTEESSEIAPPPAQQSVNGETTRPSMSTAAGAVFVDHLGESFVNEVSEAQKTNDSSFNKVSVVATQPVDENQALQHFETQSSQAVGQSFTASGLTTPQAQKSRSNYSVSHNNISEGELVVNNVQSSAPAKPEGFQGHSEVCFTADESLFPSNKDETAVMTSDSRMDNELSNLHSEPYLLNGTRLFPEENKNDVSPVTEYPETSALTSEQSQSSSEENLSSEDSRMLDRSEESEETGELTNILLAAVGNDNVASVTQRLEGTNTDAANEVTANEVNADESPDLEMLQLLAAQTNNQRLLDMLNVPMEIAFNKDDNSNHDISVCFTESVMTSMTEFASPPPAKRKNLNELYGELIAWESKRRTRYASEIEETSIHWRCRKELLREGLFETAKAERLILGAAEATKIFAETMQASYDDILIDDDGCLLTDARKQNKIMLQRQSEFYSLGNTGSSNVQEEKSALLDSLIKSQSVMSENFNQSAFVQNDVIEEMKNLRKQLQQQLTEFEKKGDQIVQGMRLAEEQVQKFWDEVDGALSDAAFSALNKASLNTSTDEDVVPGTPGRVHRKRDGWLVEMQYRVAVATENGLWECCKHDLAELYQSINNLDFQRRNKMQQVLLAFLPRQRRLFLGLPGILEPVLDGYVAYRTDHESLEANVEDAIQKQSQCYLRYEHEHRSSIMNRSRSYKPDLVQETETIDSVFGYPFESSMVRLAKVIERNSGAVWGGTWKVTLAVVTVSRYLHLFEVPESPELEIGISPNDALAAMIPPVSDLAPAVLNESSERRQARNRSADLFKGVSPAVSINLTNSVLKESAKYADHLNIIETMPGNFTSNRRRHTLRVANDMERAEWLTVLHDTKMCDDTTLSETVSDTEQSL